MHDHPLTTIHSPRCLPLKGFYSISGHGLSNNHTQRPRQIRDGGRLSGHQDAVFSVLFSPDGRLCCVFSSMSVEYIVMTHSCLQLLQQ